MELKYDQPCTIEELLQLDVELLTNEILRLQNSIMHLKRSNKELVAFSAEEDDASVKNEYASVIDENVVAIERQDERIRMIRTAISQKTGLDADNPHYAPTTDPADVQSVSVQLAGISPTVSTAATVVISELSSSTNAPAPATRNVQPVEEEEQTGVFL